MNSESQLLQQVRILDPVTNTDRIADVWLSDGLIQAIDPPSHSLSEAITVFDAQGLILAPGLVELYSHSGEPGYEDRETFSSLVAAASAGGFTRIAILPNTLPPVDNPATVALLQQKVQSFVEHIPSPIMYFWGAATLNSAGQQLTELADLALSGVIGFTDGRTLENLALLRRLLEYVQPWGKPVALFPSNTTLKGNGVMREGFASIRYGLPGNPAFSEAVALASILEMVSAIGTPVHLMRISTRRGVELIAEAKNRGIPVTASTTWMHLLLNTESIGNYDPNLHLEPPLGNEEDRKALIDGVKQGVIDAIAVEHKSYTYEEKTLAFAEAPPGCIGLELVLPLLWQEFVETGEWSALQLWQSLSTGPLLCLNQQPISCTPGHPAELVLFNPQQTWSVEQKTLKSRGINTPWLGKQLTGRIVRNYHSLLPK